MDSASAMSDSARASASASDSARARARASASDRARAYTQADIPGTSVVPVGDARANRRDFYESYKPKFIVNLDFL